MRSIDLAGFLRRTVRREDWVVLKMDTEGAEHGVLPFLRAGGAGGVLRALVDEMFLECHPPWGRDAPRMAFSHRTPRCAALFADLREEGVFVHDWD